MLRDHIPHKSLTESEICVIAYALQAYNITSNHKYQKHIHKILSIIDTSIGTGNMASLGISDFKLAIKAIKSEHSALLTYFRKTKMKKSVSQDIKSVIQKLNNCLELSVTPTQLQQVLVANAHTAQNQSVRKAMDNLYNYPKHDNLHEKAIGIVLRLLAIRITGSKFASDKKHVKNFGLIDTRIKQLKNSNNPHRSVEINQLRNLKNQGRKYVTCTYSLTHYHKDFTPMSLVDVLNMQIGMESIYKKFFVQYNQANQN